MSEDDFKKFTKDLQNKLERNESKKYSKIVTNEYRNPRNFGRLNNPDAVGKIKGPCGDTMTIYLNIENEKIKKCSFWTDGCGATIACGSMLTKMIKGKTLTELKELTCFDLLTSLEGLPLEHTHCSILAINTLNKAISNYE